MKETIKPERIAALEYLILHSKDAGKEIKDICLALIKASDNLTKPVFFTSYSEKAAYDIEDMNCALHGTHLNKLMELMGTDFYFSHHDGYFSGPSEFTIGRYPGKRFTHTIWLSPVRFDKTAVGIEIA